MRAFIHWSLIVQSFIHAFVRSFILNSFIGFPLPHGSTTGVSSPTTTPSSPFVQKSPKSDDDDYGQDDGYGDDFD
jgi:hypothetical protein